MNIVVAGGGKIGSLIACLLADSGDYNVHLLDIDFTGSDVARLKSMTSHLHLVSFDIRNGQALSDYLSQHHIKFLISSLPYYLNQGVAEACKLAQVHYFDLTEDVSVTKFVSELAKNTTSAFVPQCGLAPGFVNIVAHSLVNSFDEPEEVKLRVGALPQRSCNGLHYSLIWSTEGLVNEYANLCDAIEQGQLVKHAPLEGVEKIQLDGMTYEAFNTSGGLGSLSQSLLGRVKTLNYKTLRYPGHRDKMYFLMNELSLNKDKPTLKKILEQALPRTYEDVVIIYVSVQGKVGGAYQEKSYFKKIYPMIFREMAWSAIQVSTAAGVCAIADLVLSDERAYHGYVLQEHFDLDTVLANRFGKYFSE